MKSVILSGLFLFGLLASLTAARDRIEIFTPQGGDRPPRTPVVVELFTSEGCSSCPPADTLLARLESSQPMTGVQIIALGEHVDYWNRLGWSDPYSSQAFSARQSSYAQAFGRGRIYTPQMVVDGQVEVVGSDAGKARDAIGKAARAAKAHVEVSKEQPPGSAPPSGSHPLLVRVTRLPPRSDGDVAEVLLFLFESGLSSDVSRGENAGRKLSHAAVVRRFDVIGEIPSSEKLFEVRVPARVEKSWNRANLHAVALVQERASRQILGAARIKL